MTNEHYPCKIVAVYPDHRTASAAVRALDEVSPDDIRVIELSPYATGTGRPVKPETGMSCDTATRESDAGGTAGTAANAAAAETTVATAAILFISAPVVAPLIVLGYGAMIGGEAAGAIRGHRLRENVLGDLVKDVLKAGYHVVVIHAANNEAQKQAAAVISATLPEQTTHN